VEPLRGRAGFQFWDFPVQHSESTDNYVCLSIDGPQLSPQDAQKGLLVLDATWKLARRMQPQFAAVPTRSLPDWHTAYPRKSKTHADPDRGLATIEAIYLAYRILNRDTTGLLQHYFWADEFLRSNGLSVNGC
jgi:pre-rRNA-processing protein TSR3